MMDSDEFSAYLQDLEQRDVWEETIQPAMKRAVYASLACCQDAVCQTPVRPGSFELLGFDFMVDTSYNVWLLEINSSPDLSYSTATTRRLVPQVLPDIVKVVIDVEKMGHPSGKRPTWSKKYLNSVDSGRWELLYPQRRKKETKSRTQPL